MTATVEAGIAGDVLDDRLRRHGLTVGHHPQSAALSTVGVGRASGGAGHSSHANGTVGDLVVGLTAVLPGGARAAPRTGRSRRPHVDDAAPGHAVALARKALDEDVRLIVATGGEGTVHEVANAIEVGFCAANVATAARLHARSVERATSPRSGSPSDPTDPVVSASPSARRCTTASRTTSWWPAAATSARHVHLTDVGPRRRDPRCADQRRSGAPGAHARPRLLCRHAPAPPHPDIVEMSGSTADIDAERPLPVEADGDRWVRRPCPSGSCHRYSVCSSLRRRQTSPEADDARRVHAGHARAADEDVVVPAGRRRPAWRVLWFAHGSPRAR